MEEKGLLLSEESGQDLLIHSYMWRPFSRQGHIWADITPEKTWENVLTSERQHSEQDSVQQGQLIPSSWCKKKNSPK